MAACGVLLWVADLGVWRGWDVVVLSVCFLVVCVVLCGLVEKKKQPKSCKFKKNA